MAHWKSPVPPSARAAAIQHHSAFVTTLAQHAANASPPNVYLLIDCGIAPAVLRFARQRLAAFEHTILLQGTPEESLAERFSPWLVAIPAQIIHGWLAGEDDGLLHDICRMAQAHPAVSWLWSHCAIGALTLHLRHFLGGILLGADENIQEGEVFLRYYDARVLPSFLAALSPMQRESVLRPLVLWGLWDRHLNWQIWGGQDDATANPRGETLCYSMRQQQQMALASQPDKVLHLIGEHHGNENGSPALRQDLLDLPQDARYRKISALVHEARAIGLESDADLMLYAVLVIDVHPRFTDHPEIRTKVLPHLRDGGDFPVLLNSVSDETWNTLAAEHAAETMAHQPAASSPTKHLI